MSELIVHYFSYGHAACNIGDLPMVWPPGHRWTPEPGQVNCPLCLSGMQFGEATYEIMDDGKMMRCRRCWHLTRKPDEVLNRYCARCNARHDDIWPPARLFWLRSYAIPS